MDPLEERLSRSLEERAGDVEPTPALWQRVDRRIARRRRAVVLGWVGATAAAVLVGLAVIPPLLPDVGVPEVADAPDVAEDPDTGEDPDDSSAPDDDADADTDPDPDGPSSPAGEAPGVVTVPEPVLTAAGNELRVLDADGEEVAHLELPEEGGSTVREIAVRPGSTLEDLTAAVFTTAEGMEDLRVLRLVDGAASLEVVEDDRYRPGATGAGQPWVSGPVWAPDGTSLAWVEQDAGGSRLHTIGWDDDGPGTGEPATDNATFALETDPDDDLVLVDWVEASPDSYVLRAVTRERGEGWVHLPLTRQADGAWAQEPGAEVRSMPATGAGEGPVLALAGTSLADADGGDATEQLSPAWVVRSGSEGPVAVRLPDTVVPLPEGLLVPEADASGAWAVLVGEELVVGDREVAQAAVVGVPGTRGLLEGPVERLAPIR